MNPTRVDRRFPATSFVGYRFPPEVMLLAVRWYVRYGLSYRDVEELLAERGVDVDHVTIHRWVQRFTPLLIDAARPRRHGVGDRWLVNETYVKVARVWLALRSRTWFQAGDEEAALAEIHMAAARLATDRSSDVGSLMNGAIALIWCAEVLAELGYADDASALATRAGARMTAADVHDSVLQAMLRAIDASVARLVGNMEAAGSFLDDVDTSSSPDLHIQVTRGRARIAHSSGRADEAVALYEECLEHAERYGYAFLARSIAAELTAGPPPLRTDRAPIGQWDPRAMENVPEEHRPYALVLRLPLRDESEVLDLARRIAALLRDDPGLGHVDGTGTDGQVWEIFLDGDDADALWDAVRPLLESTPAWHTAEITKRAGFSSLRFRLDPPGP